MHWAAARPETPGAASGRSVGRKGAALQPAAEECEVAHSWNDRTTGRGGPPGAGGIVTRGVAWGRSVSGGPQAGGQVGGLPLGALVASSASPVPPDGPPSPQMAQTRSSGSRPPSKAASAHGGASVPQPASSGAAAAGAAATTPHRALGTAWETAEQSPSARRPAARTSTGGYSADFAFADRYRRLLEDGA